MLFIEGGVLLFLLLCSAFFSASETAMMSLNRYRLRHLVREKNRAAIRIANLLERTDRLLGVILFGNTFANILASSVTTVMAVAIFGEWSVLLFTMVLTIVILIFGEVAPKTLAALHPQGVATFASWPLNILLKIFYPIVWLINCISNFILHLFGIDIKKHKVTDHLSSDELRTVVLEGSGRIPSHNQDMLLRVLDLEKMQVDDVMVPRNEVVGIELNDDWGTILNKITHTTYTFMPLYHEGIDNVQGVVNLRTAMRYLADGTLDKAKLEKIAIEAYYVPEGTSLTMQLLNFKRDQQRFALVVDEYGDIQGLVTATDVIDEIVGELTSDVPSVSKFVKKDKDNAYVVDGSVNVRELNRLMDWELPTEGPKTLSGLIIEYLETIPQEKTCLKLNGYPIEILSVQANTVKTAKIFPELAIKKRE